MVQNILRAQSLEPAKDVIRFIIDILLRLGLLVFVKEDGTIQR